MLLWDIYEISSQHDLVGVKCRGRLRKYAVEQNMDFLTENASDAENRVRFALLSGTDSRSVETYVRSLFDDASIAKVMSDVPNPILSKLKINDLGRYEL
jgi:hypothetical protein